MTAPHMTPTTLDTVLGGRVILHQPAFGYRVAIDPILLAAACPAEPGESIAGPTPGRSRPDQITVADLTGTGIQDTAIATLASARAAAVANG